LLPASRLKRNRTILLNSLYMNKNNKNKLSSVTSRLPLKQIAMQINFLLAHLPC
jgi:hypothetical protein